MVVSGQQLTLWRDWAKKAAITANVPQYEVDWLLQEVAGLDRLALRLESFKERSSISLTHSLDELTELWQKRLKKRFPVQYLVGVTPWRRFSLNVSSDVLIPRPETELIIDLALQAVAESPLLDLSLGHWVDLGTGSGAIALGLAEVLTNATIHATDCSSEALAIAEKNAVQLGFAERIQFYHGSWWTPLEAFKGQISGMVSNPPYIPTDLITQLQPEVTLHEPHLALDGGQNGLECIRHLIATAPLYLHSGGIWLIEMMAGQGEIVVQMLERQGSYEKMQIFSDLAGLDRFVLAYLF